METNTVVFSETQTIHTYVVPFTDGYVIEAAGAQVPDTEESDGKGDKIRGMFYLNRGDVLKIVVGSQRLPSNAPSRTVADSLGGSIVWRGAGELPLPAKLMIAAGGGNRRNGGTESLNTGAFQTNLARVHAGAGYVSITAVPYAAPLRKKQAAAPDGSTTAGSTWKEIDAASCGETDNPSERTFSRQRV